MLQLLNILFNISLHDPKKMNDNDKNLIMTLRKSTSFKEDTADNCITGIKNHTGMFCSVSLGVSFTKYS